MPELPEVETVRKALVSSIKNKTINDVIVNRKSVLLDNPLDFVNYLKNQTIINIKRLGKHLIFILSNERILLAHLGMEGKFIFSENKNNVSKYSRIIFKFKDGSILNYDDSRTFGKLIIKNKKNYLNTPPLSKLGKEATSNINVDDFYSLINKDKRHIKEILLDQHIISGLGNIYVDETLFLSKISPLSQGHKLNKEDAKNILNNAKNILLKAIEFNGSTIHSFSWGNQKSGNFQSFLKVYNKKGKPCPICNNPLIKIKIKGRGTTYCPRCQKLKKDKYVIGLTGPISVGKTFALDEYKKHGYLTYSADEEVNNLYKNKNFQNDLIKVFNTSNKNNIRNIVANDKIALTKLENIVHPIIKNQIIHFIKETKSNKLAIEVPLLFQTGLDKLMDETLLILSNKNLKLIKKRKKKGIKQVSINKSIDYLKYKNKATYVINNNESIKEYKKELEKIII